MPIQGNKPSSYFTTFDKNGRKIEGETRMCSHCQFKWQYYPGSGKRRGYCRRCNGMLCGKVICMKYCIPYLDKIEAMEKGFNFKQLLKHCDKKYGTKMIGKITI